MSQSVPSGPSDTVLEGGTVVTMDPARTVFQDAAVVIRGDKIEWVGYRRDLPAEFAHAHHVGIHDSVICPGFVNIHTHAALSVLRGVGDDQGIAPAYSPRVPQGVFLSEEDCYTFSTLGALEAMQFGTTCMVDNYIHAEQTARAFARLGLRGVVSERLHDADLFGVAEGLYEFDERRGEELLARSFEVNKRWHGAENGRITVRFGPHAPDTCSTEYLCKIRDAAGDEGLALVLHVAQSELEVAVIKERSGLTVPGYLEQIGLLGPGMIAGHCIFVSDEDILTLARTNTQVSHQSASNSKGGMITPVRALREAGVNVGLGTDNMTSDMIEVMRLAVCAARITAGDPNAANAAQALEMATIDGAQALGMQDQIGSIECGKKADLIVLDYLKPHLVPVRDPIANLVHNGLGSDVRQVYIDGRLVIDNGQHTEFDTNGLLREAQRRSVKLWEKMEG